MNSTDIEAGDRLWRLEAFHVQEMEATGPRDQHGLIPVKKVRDGHAVGLTHLVPSLDLYDSLLSALYDWRAELREEAHTLQERLAAIDAMIVEANPF